MLNKITCFNEVVYLLKEKEVVYILHKGKMTFFALVNERIRVYNENCNYSISFEVFEELFYDETFYLHKKIEEEWISKEKDDEYYRWRHK